MMGCSSKIFRILKKTPGYKSIMILRNAFLKGMRQLYYIFLSIFLGIDVTMDPAYSATNLNNDNSGYQHGYSLYVKRIMKLFEIKLSSGGGTNYSAFLLNNSSKLMGMVHHDIQGQL